DRQEKNIQSDRQGEAPAEPRINGGMRLGRSLPLPWAPGGTDINALTLDTPETLQPPAEGAKHARDPAAGSASCPSRSVDWTKVPPLPHFPPVGWFLFPPTGPGYYSLWDVLHDHSWEKRPIFAYPPMSPMPFSFFDADFRYLDKPNNTQHDWADALKRI